MYKREGLEMHTHKYICFPKVEVFSMGLYVKVALGAEHFDDGDSVGTVSKV